MVGILDIQFNPVIGDKQANLKTVENFIAKNSDKKLDLVVIPEFFSTGISHDAFEKFPEDANGGETIAYLSELAKKYKTNIVCGTVIEKNGNNFYNTCFVLNRQGEIVCKYSKIHLFNYTGGNEGELITPGDKAVVANLDFGKVGLSVCFDMRYPLLIRKLAQMGAQIVVLPTAWVIPNKIYNNDKLQALIFDSMYESYRGAIIWVRVVNGSLKTGDKIKMVNKGSIYEITEIGVHNPKEKKKDELKAGEVGYLCASIKSVSDIMVGDTITKVKEDASSLDGYKPMKPMVFCGLYPIESNKYNDLKDALEKLKLNDAALSFEPENSTALGFGFRCGFLGMLHMDVTQERLEREFNLDIIATSPSVVYEVVLTNNDVIMLDNPNKMPDQTKIKEIKEPYIKTNIFVPSEFVGDVMTLCQDKRGTYIDMDYINKTRVNIHYELPLSEVVYDFFDKLKSYTKGYASFDYELIGYKESKLVKMDILINGEAVDALSVITHKDFAYQRGKKVVENLRKLIPRQLFEIPLQAVINNKVIARTDIKAMKKNVLAKCYGGDVSRKRKLLEKQKEGKKRMKKVGSVDVPQEAFLSVLGVDDK